MKNSFHLRELCKALRDYVVSQNCCRNCGSQTELQFHHVDRAAKSGTINEVIKTRQFNRVLAEINKCCMLCRRCHERHHNIRPLENLVTLCYTRKELFPLAKNHVENTINNRQSKDTTTWIQDGDNQPSV